MTSLSPAAQAVLDAATKAAWSSAFNSEGKGAAAALRAAVDQVVPVEDPWPHYKLGAIRHRILTIADELEATP